MHKGTFKKKKRQKLFLEAYSELGHIGAACKQVGISYSVVQVWKQDEDFLLELEGAKEVFDGSIHNEVIRRAVHGISKPLIHKGQVQYLRDPTTGELLLDDDLKPIIATVNEKSNSLLAMAAKATVKAYQPEKSEPVTKVEVSGPEGEPIKNFIQVEFVAPIAAEIATRTETEVED